MPNWDYPCSEPVDITIDSWAAGSIAISGEPTSTLSVEVLPSRRTGNAEELLAEVEVSFEDGQLYVHGPRPGAFHRNRGLDLTIKAPAGSGCAAKTASADLTCVGEIGALTAHTASGDVTAAAVTGDVTVHTASGDVMLQEAGGDVSFATASGDIQLVRVAGETQARSASGDVTIGQCGGSLSVNTASGDVRVSAAQAGKVHLNSASGDLRVGVVPGIAVYLDLSSTSGDVKSQLDPAGDEEPADAAIEIKCRTLSGDITITKAA
ncbi:MAG TPA: DUF4097 family beta strand repeat-containing protein [Streptosporangiaceae bacterium]|jgi:hypothetical protein